MTERTIRIDSLHLHVPHMSREQAHQMAQDVTDQVANSLSDKINPRNLSSLKLNITAPKGADQSRISALVAQAIAKAIS